MDRHQIATVTLAAGLALWFGPGIGYDWWGQPDFMHAALFGCATVFIAVYAGMNAALEHVEFKNTVLLGFAGLMTYRWGVPAGHALWRKTDHGEAALYGGTSVFLTALAVAWFAWPFASDLYDTVFGSAERGAGQLTQKVGGKGPTEAGQLEREIENGKGPTYKGEINRPFTYIDGRTKRKYVRASFRVQRNGMMMTPTERAAFRVLTVLQRNGLDTRTARHLTFALAWGDGQGVWSCSSFRAPLPLLQQNHITTPEALIRHEASVQGASVASACNQLFSLLARMATKRNAAPEVVQLYKSLQAPAQHSLVSDDQWV